MFHVKHFRFQEQKGTQRFMVIDSKSLKYLQEIPNVSRETFLERVVSPLEAYVSLTLEWQKAINLISPATIPDIWWRHIIDSAQLFSLIPSHTKSILDIGSGGGFPAIVLSILADNQVAFTLVESDRRKCIFLREAIRVARLQNITIITERVEKLPAQTFDLVTARALATTQQLMDWAGPYSNRFLFPKGEQADTEITDQLLKSYKIETFQSVTDKKAKILRLEKL